MTRRTTILVVDDDADIRAFLTLALEDQGFAVESADDGLSALQKVRRQAPDAVILDLNMPRMGGEDFLYAWRAGVETSGVPVIVISAAYRGLEPGDLGVAAFFPKPFDLPALVQHVERLVASSPQAPAAARPDAPSLEVDEVIEGLAHHLSAALGCVELLAEDESIPEDLRPLAVLALEHTQRASATVRQLRHLTRAVEGE